MNRPRIPLGLESARAALNHEACTRLGRLFADARAQRGLDVRDAAARLLLSPRQVVGLETADGDAFYSAELYLVAARKYDALLGLASPLVDEILVPPVLDTQAPVAPVAVARRPPVRLAAAASLAAAVTLAVGGWVVLRGIPVTDDPVANDAAPAVVAPADMPTLQDLVSTQLPPAPVAVRLARRSWLWLPHARARALRRHPGSEGCWSYFSLRFQVVSTTGQPRTGCSRIRTF